MRQITRHGAIMGVSNIRTKYSIKKGKHLVGSNLQSNLSCLVCSASLKRVYQERSEPSKARKSHSMKQCRPSANDIDSLKI